MLDVESIFGPRVIDPNYLYSSHPYTPHVDLFATHLNHKVLLFVSPVPDQHDIGALKISWLGLTA